MLDAQPAANAPARPPAVQPLPASPAIADAPGVRSKPAALLAAATALLPNMEAGRALDAKTLREAMSAAFGAGDAQGAWAWAWKDAYEAAEAAMVLFIQRYGRLMRREAGAGPGSAAAMLAMLETLAALEPSQTRRSEEQLALQQFSTPLPLAYAALQAAAIRPGDIVLEPSAGTGMLAVMAECALGKRTDDARSGNPLHLNEIAAVRAGLLSGLFAHAPVTRHNAEAIADYLPGLRPTVVLMNPPFSASPGVQRTRHDADLRHLRSAFSMLPAGGRLVAITSAGCIPGDAAWSRAFERLDPPPRTVFSIAIDGRAYARRGTTFDTRLTVIDRANASGVPIDARESVPTAAGLLAASANLAETAAFMAGDKRILVFSMAGGTGRSYHADLSCGNTARRIHYLLEPGWRADQAIQGLGRTHRTHQASAPLFRPVTTDVKGERRFIATIARRLDSLGAITRGQRDSQTAMGGGGATLFRASDNLESPYAKVALRQFYIALWRGNIAGWSMDRFEDATGLKLIWEGSLKEDLPPMPRFLNRLLALPITEQNELFAELETRIEANIEQAIEAGTHERGVETIRADSLTVASRETVHVHEASGAATELVEIIRRDRLVPLTADDALAMRDGRPVINTRSKRAAVVLPAPSRMFEDGGVEARVRLVRPAAREPMAAEELAASNWKDAGGDRWRSLWDTEIEGLPSHTESRLWLVTGLLLPIWDRLPGENMRVRRLATDAGESLLGRVLTPEQAHAFRDAFGLAGGPGMSPAEMHEAILTRGASFDFANGWRLARRRLMGAGRVEIEGPADGDLAALKRVGCATEIVSWRTRVFVPGYIDLGRILERWPLAVATPA